MASPLLQKKQITPEAISKHQFWYVGRYNFNGLQRQKSVLKWLALKVTKQKVNTESRA
jgi:hypothetical protein